MNSVPAGYDVVVVGGGVVGLAVAWRVAQRLDGSVAVVDPAPGTGASAVAAGMLAPVTEAHYGEQGLLRLNLQAAARYPETVAELEDATGHRVGYRTCGTLAVALDAGDLAVLNDLREFQRDLGLDVQALTGRECRRLEPILSPAVQGGVHVAGDHQVDPRRLVAALLTAAQQAGVQLVERSAVSLTTKEDVVTGIGLDDGTAVLAGIVVIAAGCRSGELDGLPADIRPPVRPVKGQVLRLRVPSPYQPLLSRTVRGIVRGFPVYLLPREDGELVVGATQEEQGFDQEVTAGGVYELLRDARALVPAVTELPLTETRAGLRPGTPDNAPVIGPTRVAGLVFATGHYRQGILQAPATADAVAELLVSEALPEYMAPFAPARFAHREPDGGQQEDEVRA